MPKRVCLEPGCQALVEKPLAYCPKHKRVITEDRPSAYKRGYDSKWQNYRKAYLAKHPFCVECLKEGKEVLATDVDHIIPHKGSKILFWSTDNHQALCHSCHSRKTAKEDMGRWY